MCCCIRVQRLLVRIITVHSSRTKTNLVIYIYISQACEIYNLLRSAGDERFEIRKIGISTIQNVLW